MFGVLISFIIVNGVYSTAKWYSEESEEQDKQLDNKLTIAHSIIANEIEKIKNINLIVREQNAKFQELMNYDNDRAINIILQGYAQSYNIDLILFFDQDGLLTTNQLLRKKNYQFEYQTLFQEQNTQKTGLELLPAELFSNQSTTDDVLLSKKSILCLITVVELVDDVGDDSGYIVILKRLDLYQQLSTRIASLSGAEVILHDQSDQVILSSLPRRLFSLNKHNLRVKDKVFASKSMPVLGINGNVIAGLVIAVDNATLIEQSSEHVLSNLFPFVITVAISIIIFLILKFLIFNKVNHLISILKIVASGDLTARISIEKPLVAEDEMSEMMLNFNLMMDRMEASYREVESNHQELERLNKEKNKFLGVVAHDLRSPIGAISGYAEILIDEDVNKEESKEIIRNVKMISRDMLLMVNDLLDISMIERGQLVLNLTETPIKKLLSRRIQSLHFNAEKKGIKLLMNEVDDDVCLIDPNRVAQVIDNLICNSIKFSPEQSSIQCSVKCEKDQMVLKISDEGFGIPKNELKNIFGEGSTTSTKSREGEKSTGLGLAIVKKIVDAHGGEITLNSIEGKGTEFTILFPQALR